MAEPKELMAEAQLLIGRQPGAAMRLLTDGRGDLDAVPPAYDIMLARAALASGQAEAGLALLSGVVDGREDAPPNLLRAYGDLFLDLGRIGQAGRQYHLAVQGGSPFDLLPTREKLVLQDRARAGKRVSLPGDELDLRVMADFGVYDSAHKVLLVYIPKVACSVLKATVVMNSPRREAYLAFGKPIHDFVQEERREGNAVAALSAPDVFRFAVLREPGARILSAYLNKFVRGGPNESPGITRDKNYAIRVGQKLAGVPADLARGITFEEFVQFLASASDAELNLHWMPQSRFVGTDLGRYDFVGRFERLSETFEMLEERFGYVTEREASVHLGGSKNNTTHYNPAVKMANPQRCLPAELRGLRFGYPPAQAFLTDGIRASLAKRFADDVRLHEQT
jgi:hypothetical protein